MPKLKANAETRPSDSGECPPPAGFSDPLSQTPALTARHAWTEEDRLAWENTPGKIMPMWDAPTPAQSDDVRSVLNFVESWVSNPVGSYSVHALDGLFAMTRDKIAALQPPQPTKSKV